MSQYGGGQVLLSPLSHYRSHSHSHSLSSLRSHASAPKLSDAVYQRPPLWPALREACELCRLSYRAA